MKRYGLAILKYDYCGYNDRSKTMILPYEFDSVEDAQDKIVDIYLTAYKNIFRFFPHKN